MKIVIATAVYYPMINGVAVFSHNLAAGLAERGHEVLVLTPSQTGRRYTRTVDGVKVCYLSSTTVKVYPDQIHSVPKKRRLFYKHGFKVSVFPGRQVRRILAEFAPDVVHIQVSDPIGLSVAGWARKANVPVVTTEHNQPEVLTEPLHMPGVVRKPVNALLSSYFANRQNKSDFVTMPTKLAIDNLRKGRKELTVPMMAVSNGVDLANFRPGRASEEVYEKFGVPQGRPIVLYVGRVDPEKRVGTVIDAFKQARMKIPAAVLLIVGDGVDKTRLMAKVEKEGIEAVKFLGRITGPELAEIYRMGSVFVTASEIETQGIVLIEAAASGLPLIAVNAGAVAEICRNSENGYLLEPGAEVAKNMAVAMEWILSNPEMRKKFSKRSVELAREHDFKGTLDKFEEIYRQVVENPTKITQKSDKKSREKYTQTE